MALTSDDLMAMHTVAVNCIAENQSIEERFEDTKPLNDAEIRSILASLNTATRNLAVIQRDLLKAMLGG